MNRQALVSWAAAGAGTLLAMRALRRTRAIGLDGRVVGGETRLTEVEPASVRCGGVDNFENGTYIVEEVVSSSPPWENSHDIGGCS
jgi:hypothetical protein